MPPILSDAESDDINIPDNIPAREKPVENPEQEEEDDDDDEEDGEEYRVERILDHNFNGDGNAVLYKIKWLGFEKKADQTWEPIENLTGASELLDEYHQKIGGPPVFEAKASAKKGGRGKKRGASDAFASESPAPTSANGNKKSGRNSNGVQAEDAGAPKYNIPTGSWEDAVARVTSILQEDIEDNKNKSKKVLKCFVQWKDGNRTEHQMDVMRRKCPQKVLDYYELHLVFTKDGGAEDSLKMEEDRVYFTENSVTVQ